ncbi:hypothetical protein MKK70_16765 [Methylobacterium sp. E-041]|uniref:hypothetical protein n=1 Tax=Methylobacterium sp. E-041 TaxID=2836573 RepID=UPI001FB8B976|nr:hypothetical protein [Methylobacterium sp. E-041]MCJ2106999.1 hypothetical protein [Methylobacterium sp. E-041]
MTKHNAARPQVQPAAVHADQRDRAARLRDASGRFTKSQDATPASSAAGGLPAQSATIPAPAGAPDDAYALSVNDDSLGLHAAPGSAIVVAPTMPTGAGLAVFYLKGRSGNVVYDLTHGFRPERTIAFAPDSELMPLIEVVVPGTGQTGGLRAEIVEKIHRVVGVYTPVEVADNAPSLPSKLPVLSECPEGMGEQYAYDAAAYPLVRKGETVVYDPSRREPTHGALYVMQWDNGSARDVMLTNLRKVGGQGEARWWVDPVNRIGVGTRYASDGPYDADHLRGKIVGAVVGVLVPQRVSELVQPKTADEIYAAAERERKAVERAALNTVGLTSGVSAEVRAAIMRHGEVMRETELQGDETDEEFNLDADMQNEAEHAVAHTPAHTNRRLG